MHNQNWHVVYGPAKTQADISPDTQVSEAVETVFRMDGQPWGEPGPEIVVSVYAAYADPNGQRNDGSWPDIVVATQVAYQIREADGEVNDADYEYTQSEYSWPGHAYSGSPSVILSTVAQEAGAIAARGDMGWDWNGESAMHRSGGPV